MTIQNKRVTYIMLAVVPILGIPIIAMQFTNEVAWTTSDFVMMGGLLLGTGFLCEITLRKIKRKVYKPVIIAIFLIALFLIWAELAVGIFGTPFAGS